MREFATAKMERQAPPAPRVERLYERPEPREPVAPDMETQVSVGAVLKVSVPDEPLEVRA